MIVFVPFSPEIPKRFEPRLWQALVMILVLIAAFIGCRDLLDRDSDYAEKFPRVASGDEAEDEDNEGKLGPTAELYLSKRPLLAVVPARGDWDVGRLILANFVHGSTAHLFLNLIGVFAAFRLATTFVSFWLSLSVFLLGGSIGLLASILYAREPSQFIPHVGSSGGVFALLGLYYIFNFNYRTVYFFWFPSRNGFAKLRTRLFFFIDAFLLEFVLSVGQFLPEKVDSIDHLAHVVGFASGVGLALVVRLSQGWPTFLQTRTEYLFWRQLVNRKNHTSNLIQGTLLYQNILQINPYNDQAKLRLLRLTGPHCVDMPAEEAATILTYVSPTFVRLHTRAVSDYVSHFLESGKKLPMRWLRRMPYDSVILLCREIASTQERRRHVLELVQQYYEAHPQNDAHQRKLEQLARRLAEAEAS